MPPAPFLVVVAVGWVRLEEVLVGTKVTEEEGGDAGGEEEAGGDREAGEDEAGDETSQRGKAFAPPAVQQ
jgi:hypothetical protein